MEGQSVPKSISCIPCAKRKVRCDRLEPCSHCKRRKGDVCEYPLPSGSPAKAQASDDLLRMQQDRIEKLEKYILEQSDEPHQPHHAPSASLAERSTSNVNRPSITIDSSHTQGTKRSYDGTAQPAQKRLLPYQQACLVEHNKETTYIDAPVWYSWNEARKPENELHEVQQEINRAHYSQDNSSRGYNTTLLDATNTGAKFNLYQQHPSSDEIHALWKVYLANVHPVVKIFFDWDKETLIHKAARDPASLSQDQQTLVFAIYFIATLSLQHEECKDLLNLSTKPSLLNFFQSVVETALLAANYAETSDLLVLQALILYLLAMRNRAKPATSFSMLGIAGRIAQRQGLHRDGSLLSLSPMKAEERRRVWWSLQHMEILVGQLTGCLAVTLYADWDTKLPANLEDDEISLDMEELPPDRHGLTSMSHCLWRYYVLHWQRSRKDSGEAVAWTTSSLVPIPAKDALMERYRTQLAEKFLQYCEPVNPLHVHIQIGIQNLLLAMQRSARQGLSNARISEMSLNDRDDLLKICIKCMEYYIYSETTQLVAHLRWHNENYFQWTAFVYVLIEAHYHATTPRASDLWILIDKVCTLHPKMTTATERPEILTIGNLILRAWQQRQQYLQELQKNIEKPWCVSELERALNVFPPNPDANGYSLLTGVDGLGSFDFDFIDWSSWEMGVPPR